MDYWEWLWNLETHWHVVMDYWTDVVMDYWTDSDGLLGLICDVQE